MLNWSLIIINNDNNNGVLECPFFKWALGMYISYSSLKQNQKPKTADIKIHYINIHKFDTLLTYTNLSFLCDDLDAKTQGLVV